MYFLCKKLVYWYQPRIPLLAGMWTEVPYFATACGYPEVFLFGFLVKIKHLSSVIFNFKIETLVL